jgi:hypothetical protein
MTTPGQKIIEGAKEALAIARGEQPAASIHHNGFTYVPKPVWQPIETARLDGKLCLLRLGETIPELPNIRGGSFINEEECVGLGEFEHEQTGGWLIWNSGSDWFVIGRDEPTGWAEPPSD